MTTVNLNTFSCLNFPRSKQQTSQCYLLIGKFCAEELACPPLINVNERLGTYHILTMVMSVAMTVSIKDGVNLEFHLNRISSKFQIQIEHQIKYEYSVVCFVKYICLSNVTW